GTTTLTGTSTIGATGNALLTGRTLDNHGTATLSSSATNSPLFIFNGGVWNNLAVGVLILPDDVFLLVRTSICLGPLNNSATIRKIGTGTSTILISGVVNNSGTFDVPNAGSSLTLNGTVNLNTGTTSTGDGTVVFNGGTMTVTGDASLHNFTFTNSTLTG